jgi:hypothetical protein
MEEDEKNIELIEAFLKGDLAGAELADFEMRRKADPDFDQQVTDYTLIMKEIRSTQELAFLDKLSTWEKGIEATEKKGKVVPMGWILSIAATVSVLAIVTFVIFNEFSGENTEQLFVTYFQPYKDVISERSLDAGSLQEGMNLYNGGNYRQAIPQLRNYLSEKPGDVAAQCYLATSYLASDSVGRAKQMFESLIRDDDGLYKEIAQWNLTLIYLKENETELFTSALNDILNQKNHLYASEAASLSSKLN